MDHTFNQTWLAAKFEEIRRRLLKAISQLNDEQLNWRPSDESHSIATLIRHIIGNMKERVEKGILLRDVVRDRALDFVPNPLTKEELLSIVEERFGFLIETVKGLTEADLARTQTVRAKERTNLDMLHQCAVHYSEHMGQIFYIAKMCLNESYASTSI
ncbi:uncharacterized protein DUF1572 [Paenibacillus cellulosilyticus]|uniref:Uncharacterized protein DUF1572 n=1 Tax=Paenibacillus cellulosilyticus TaxID=375489 RepID=A0A2V2YM02_9BACL|nr:DUF1572 family protein [Paenibacillus cellulosilyticus]PWV94534.1 uncharacterized protein DUF1572 [Paenibacillus cellulosilyticus]QKS45038.1 DUF1572 family protein [Paenibacillus cellulosilyticus]